MAEQKAETKTKLMAEGRSPRQLKPTSAKGWSAQVTNPAIKKGPDASIDWKEVPIPGKHIRVICRSHVIGRPWVYVDKYVGGENGEGIKQAYKAKADDPFNHNIWRVME